jgi:hypothetical protein
MRGNDAVRGMFSYVGANVLSREIINNYSKPYKRETVVAVLSELVDYLQHR